MSSLVFVESNFNDEIFAKLCQKANLTEDTFVVDSEKCCTICNDSFENETGDIITPLKCGHKFHHSCIKEWYLKNKKIVGNSKKTSNHTMRSCPLCRKQGGYLPLKDGETPIKDIHKECEDNVAPKVVKNKKVPIFTELMEYYPYSPNTCQAILKSKPGVQCFCKAKWGLPESSAKYCGRHKSLLH